MKNRIVPDSVEIEKIVITEISEMGLISYQGINIKISETETISAINGMGRNEYEARMNFRREWDNRSTEIFGRIVPIFCKNRDIRKKA
jgi:hypothetical protein